MAYVFLYLTPCSIYFSFDQSLSVNQSFLTSLQAVCRVSKPGGSQWRVSLCYKLAKYDRFDAAVGGGVFTNG